jgi:hypothetical protein
LREVGDDIGVSGQIGVVEGRIWPGFAEGFVRDGAEKKETHFG